MEQTGSYLVFTWDYAAQGRHSSACSGPQSSGLRYQRPADFAQNGCSRSDFYGLRVNVYLVPPTKAILVARVHN